MSLETLDILKNVSRETLDGLDRFVQLVAKWNPTINLVAKNSLADVWVRHIKDSVQLIPLAATGRAWIDLGSGGGFPGIVVSVVLKEVAPETCMYLVESDARKATFLREASRALRLNCQVVNQRIDEINLPPATVISARALAHLDKLLHFSKRLVDLDGVCLFMKGKSHQDEVRLARESWKFDCEVIQSKTSAEAAVLRIRNIECAAKKT